MGKRGTKPRRKEIVWSPELAYAIGLIATDGCLSNDGRHLDFTSKDRAQIENLRKCLGITANIFKKGNGTLKGRDRYYRVQWGDVFFYNFLLDVGLMPNKSKRLGPLAIPDEYFFDFLRGSFDGDGSFYSYFDPRWKSSFMYYLNFTSASPPHIDWLRETLHRLLGVNGHISKAGGKEKERDLIINLRFAKEESLVVMNAIYSTSCATHLSRKRLKIERALRIVGKSLSPIKKKLTR